MCLLEKVSMGTVGDCWDRYYVRVQEMQGIYLKLYVKHVLKVCQKVMFLKSLPKKIRPNKGEVYGRYESARGDVGFYIISNGKNIPLGVKMRSPAFCNLICIK